ncbi:Wadjet anti-phage system protein JetD domain-containing protein [Nocardia miyunensis]|uniref:Wadjet anti-phage system protein JetD domain-containing protein n=1 Tax=Nocardia miyunensis TaxID=282684 RepID=UPI00083728FF|nr:Wadjet anti-phage system protein JetD domain-containing protein [Nocardia miyunensis]
MTARLVTVQAALDTIRRKIDQKWADAVCAERGIGVPVSFSVPLRPGVSTGKSVGQIGYDHWHAWHAAWRLFETQVISGVERVKIIRKPVTIRGVADEFPAMLVAETFSAAIELAGRAQASPLAVDVDRARILAESLDAIGATLTPATLKGAHRLADSDTEILFAAVSWLRDHPDVGEWTARQLPVPGMHSKWLETHSALLAMVAGRDVRAEVRPRLAVVHLTYVDPDYTDSGRRRHDSWTTGDVHDLAYEPRVVLIVENRDCRLWFPPAKDTIIVEGSGKAAASLLVGITWIRAAEHVVYWGDIDADGYAILDRLRAAMGTPTTDGLPAKTVHSLLMDASDLHRYARHGVNHDKAGHPIKPSPARLTHLTQTEADAYDFVATAGPALFRRIEQEAMPLYDVAAQLDLLINTLSTPTLPPNDDTRTTRQI